MMHQPADILVTTRPDRRFKRVERKTGTQVIRNLPADNPAREQIHHERRIHPPGKCHHIRDVRYPAPVRRRRVETARQQVRRPVRRITRHRRARPLPPGLHAADPQAVHQPLHRAPRDRNTLPVQFQPHFPRTVNLPALPAVFPHLHNLVLQGGIPGFPRRRLRHALLRVVIRRHGKFQDRTDRLDAKPVPVRINELD
jgi:hypothetical protein